jgi:hypothetical protein
MASRAYLVGFTRKDAAGGLVLALVFVQGDAGNTMVFGWLFGERKRQEAEGPDVAALVAQADEATNAREVQKGEALCREILKQATANADAWNMLGVNLIRRGIGDPEVRAEAVIAWMRVLALRPGDARAADHLRAEIQFPDELVPRLVARLSDQSQVGDDAAAVLAQVGEKARAALDTAAAAGGSAAERARALLTNLP